MRSSPRVRAGVLIAALLCVAAPVAACGSQGSASSGGGSVASDKFHQTWPTGYGSTTCQQWATKMTSDQKFAAAADMLVGARSTDDKNAGLPSDSLIRSFEGDIGQGCEPIASMTITDAATGVYMLGRAQYSP